jgi:hypothetical protein
MNIQEQIKFKGKVEVEVIKKKDVPLFLAEREVKEIEAKIDFLNQELLKM